MAHEQKGCTKIDKPIAILGTGNMGSAILKGILRAELTSPSKIIACDISKPKLSALETEWKVSTAIDLSEAVHSAGILLLCVKPQMLSSVLENIKDSVRADQLIISIIAGMRIANIQRAISVKAGIVRTMPNIAATVGESATALAFGEYVSAEQQNIAKAIFESIGEVVVVSEEQLDAVTGLSGSGPAYIFMVIEALADGGVEMGLSRDIAKKLAVQTVLGSAILAKTSGVQPSILRDQVTTPGGTTARAIKELRSQSIGSWMRNIAGLHSMLINAMTKAALRSEEISRMLNSKS